MILSIPQFLTTIFLIFLIHVVGTMPQRNSTHVSLNIPQEGAVISFNCTAAGKKRPIFWILPDGSRVYVDQQNIIRRDQKCEGCLKVEQKYGGAQNRTLLHDRENQNHDFGDFDGLLNISENQLTILGVRRGMDGQYVCIVRDDHRQVFFIPYVIARADYSQSVLISLCVSLGFAFACCSVLVLDRYFLTFESSRDGRQFWFRRIHDSSSIASNQPMRIPSRKDNRTVNTFGTDDVSECTQHQEITHC